jgi:arylsulfatase
MTDQPNILWITTDQQRGDTIHALGNGPVHTPNLDRLCAEGVAFTRAYCQNPICTPSRASFLTGLYPSRLPCNINGNARCHLPAGVKLITRRLADAGYDCGLAGKLHIASAWNGVEARVDDGYRRFWYSHSPAQGIGKGNQYTDWLASIGRLDEVIDQSNWDPDLQTGNRQTPDVPFELHQTTWCCDRAIEFMNEPRTGPWLMSVNIFDPHPAYDAPWAYAGRYDPASLPPPPFRASDLALQRRISETHFFPSHPRAPGSTEQQHRASYYGMIELIDENVGRLLAELERTGLRENTVVVFTSDHGNLLGDHGLTEKGCRFYEGLVRVPLIIAWPHRFRRGAVETGLMELTDLAPTLAELGGAALPPCDGRSLVPVLTGNGQVEREFVRCEFYDTLDHDFGRPERAPHRESYATMTRDRRWKLVAYHGSDVGELYDLVSDPDEHENRYTDPACAGNRARLARAMESTAPVTRDPMERIGRF